MTTLHLLFTSLPTFEVLEVRVLRRLHHGTTRRKGISRGNFSANFPRNEDVYYISTLYVPPQGVALLNEQSSYIRLEKYHTVPFITATNYQESFAP